MRMKPLNVRKNKGTIECDKSTVTYNVCIAQYKNETVKCKKKKKETTKCDKNTIKCDVRIAKCEKK